MHVVWDPTTSPVFEHRKECLVPEAPRRVKWEAGPCLYSLLQKLSMHLGWHGHFMLLIAAA